MNDRELIELAAKAAKIGGWWGDRFEYHNGAVDLSDMWILDQEEFCAWNPLIDDGDALRLAVHLELSVYPPSRAYPKACCQNNDASIDITEEGEPMTGTRRAIVRAAAEIGKSL